MINWNDLKPFLHGGRELDEVLLVLCRN